MCNLSRYAKNRDNNFNLIRFIAALLVLYTHSYALVIGSGDAEPLRGWLGITWGSVAVDVFFITSGFLIANSFFVKNNMVAFIWARCLRIYPALVVAIIFCVFVVGLFFTTYSITEYFSTPQTWKYLVKNISLVLNTEWYLPGVFQDVPYKGAVNGSLWTLPFEVKMYVCLATLGSIVLFIQGKTGEEVLKKVFLSLAIISVVINVLNYFQHFMSVKRLVDFIDLFSMFFVGVVAYLFREKVYLKLRFFVLSFFTLMLSCFNQDVFVVIYPIVLPYCIFYIAYVPAGWVRSFNKVGDYSYGIYIYAFPVQQSIIALNPNISISMMILLSASVTLPLAFLSWHVVEQRCLKLKNKYIVIEQQIKRIKLG